MISLTRAEIEAFIDLPTAALAIEDAYRASSMGQVTLPPVGHITFPDQNADCHIKFGHLKGEKTFVIKVATGFPQNSQRGLPSGNGIVLVMSAETGAVQAVLHDEMMLTDIRTGLGGAVASRALARPDSIQALIIGTGPQARRQIEAHSQLMPKLAFQLWGRDAGKVETLIAEMSGTYNLTPAQDLQSAVRQADIIVTATGATEPILSSDWVRPGAHITAVGADAPGKQELGVTLVKRADILAVDRISQCVDHGEVSHAIKKRLVCADDLIEIGTLLRFPERGRTNEMQITIADLTGIAAQDIALANVVLAARLARDS